MWIITQNGQRMINSDKVSEIFIDNTGSKVCALIDKTANYSVVLGKYLSRDNSKKVFDGVCSSIISSLPAMDIPSDADIDEWVKVQDTVLSTYLSKTFIK